MLKIIWLKNAEDQLDKIYHYYEKKVSSSLVKKFYLDKQKLEINY
jgi:plasmid stabilization system protein ParE